MTLNPYKRRVENVMSKVVVTANATDTLRDALTLMHENQISSLPVVNQRNRCIGIISATDFIELARELEQEISDLGKVSDVTRQWLLEKISEHDMGNQPLSSRMNASVMSIPPQAPLAIAAAEMLRHRVHHLPVLDETGRLLGIISTTDIMNAFVEGQED